MHHVAKMKARHIRLLLLNVLALFSPAVILTAGTIEYYPEANAFLVNDFSEEQPVILKNIYEYDQNRKSGKISYNPAEDNYKVEASIWIGDPNRPASAFMQIGRPDHPYESLEIAGNIWIRPPVKSVVRADGRRALVNRLTAGNLLDPKIKPKIFFACSANGQYGLITGGRFSNKQKTNEFIYGGDLFLYHTVVSAVVPDGKHNFKNNNPENLKPINAIIAEDACELRLINSEFSCFNGFLIAGAQQDKQIIRGCTFENGMFVAGTLTAEHCIFRKLLLLTIRETELFDCILENNTYNFDFSGIECRGPVSLTNCRLGPPQKENSWTKNNFKRPAWDTRPIFPYLDERAAIVVQVQDAKNAPIKSAIVEIKCEKNPEALIASTALTDKSGKTPASLDNNPMIVLLKKTQATETPGKPLSTYYEYTASINAPGYKAKRISLSSKDMYQDYAGGNIDVLVRLEKK